MSTSKKIAGTEHACRRRAVAGLALATLLIATGIASACQDGTPPWPPLVSPCTDFGCEK